MPLSLDDIKYFNVVATTKNVTRASEVLGISQPTLSYAIKRLEQELGGELFIRLKNGVELTHLGQEFEKRGQAVLFEWEQARKVISEYKNEVVGRYTIGLHASVALYTLEHFLPSLNQRYPGLELVFKHHLSRTITEQVISWKIDFGLVINPKRHPDLVIKELCKDRVTLFTNGSKKKIETLIFDHNLHQSQTIIKKMKGNQRKYKHMTSDNLEVIAKMVSLGLGIGILPQRVAQHYPELKEVKGAPFFIDRLCLIYRKEKQKGLASKTIIQAISQANF